jgi:hypothetical protein
MTKSVRGAKGKRAAAKVPKPARVLKPAKARTPAKGRKKALKPRYVDEPLLQSALRDTDPSEASEGSRRPQELLKAESAGRVAKRVAKHRAEMQRRGMKLLQIWVPDTSSPDFLAEARRQSLLVRDGPDDAEWSEAAVAELDLGPPYEG